MTSQFLGRRSSTAPRQLSQPEPSPRKARPGLRMARLRLLLQVWPETPPHRVDFRSPQAAPLGPCQAARPPETQAPGQSHHHVEEAGVLPPGGGCGAGGLEPRAPGPRANVRTRSRAFCSRDTVGMWPVQRPEGLAIATSAQSGSSRPAGAAAHFSQGKRGWPLCAARVTVKINPEQETRTDGQRASYTAPFNGCFHKCMNNLNYHCRAFIRGFRGKMPRLFAPPVPFIFVSSPLCAARAAPLPSRARTMGCGGAGARKKAALVAVSCLTLINEGADTGRIRESRGEPGPEGARSGGQGLAAGRPRPALHAQWERAEGDELGPEPPPGARDGHALDGGRAGPRPPPGRGRERPARPPSWGARAGSPPAHTRLLGASRSGALRLVPGAGRVPPE